MKVVIIEDETPAATRLTRMLEKIDDNIEVIKRLDSVESSVRYLSSAAEVDLIFMDVQLADGLCWDIFQRWAWPLQRSCSTSAPCTDA